MSWVRTDSDISVFVENLAPPTTFYKQRGVEFHTEGVHLIISSANSYRQIPLVKAGELEIWQVRFWHSDTIVRAILSIGVTESP